MANFQCVEVNWNIDHASLACNKPFPAVATRIRTQGRVVAVRQIPPTARPAVAANPRQQPPRTVFAYCASRDAAAVVQADGCWVIPIFG